MPTPHEPLAVPLPLEQYAETFDDLFHTHIQRRRFREYLAGLLLPRERNKTLTALVGAEPITQAQTAPVQQLQFFLSESAWEAEAVTTRQIEVLRATPLTAPHAAGALVLDETGDRKDGTKTEHVGYQYLGSIGKVANGIVAVSSLWADEQVYYPLQAHPYTPEARLAGGKKHPTFRTKPQLALELVLAGPGRARCWHPLPCGGRRQPVRGASGVQARHVAGRHPVCARGQALPNRLDPAS